MPQFEYKTEILTSIVGRDKLQLGDLDDELRKHGDDGWELVTCVLDADHPREPRRAPADLQAPPRVTDLRRAMMRACRWKVAARAARCATGSRPSR